MAKGFYYILSSLFFLITISVKAQMPQWMESNKQEVAKDFERMNNWYRTTPAYSVNVTHSTFEDYKTLSPFERMTGYFYKDHNNYHSFLLGIHTIQNAKCKVVVDTSNTIILVATPDKTFENAINMKEFEDGLSICKVFKKIESAKEKRLRLEFGTAGTINAYEIIIYPEGMVKEIVVFYNKAVKKDEDDPKSEKKKPRLTISFSNYKTNVKFNYSEEFSETEYIKIDDKKKLTLQNKYKIFKLSDQRLMIN